MPGTHQPINAYEQIKEFYEGTKAAIEAETGVPEGSWGHATDGGGDIGYYLGGWIWQSDITGIPLSYLDTDGTLAANSDVKVATQKATKTYVDASVVGLWDFQGVIDCSGSPNYPAALQGDAYLVNPGGQIGGASGVAVDPGDVIVAIADNAGGTQAAVGSSWTILEKNLQGALLASNNLSDLASAITARTNLGVSYEIIMDTIATMLLNGDHNGLTLNYDDVSDAFDMPLDDTYVDGLIDSNISINRPNRNFILNGGGTIWQRGTSFTSIADATRIADNFKYGKAGVVVHDVTRDTDVPTIAESGYKSNYSIKLDVTTVDASIAAGDFSGLQSFIEGYEYASLKDQTVTLSFWVKSVKTGIHCVSFRNNGNDRSYVVEYTINAASTWEKKTITLVLNQSGGTEAYNHTLGLSIFWSIAAGSTFQTTANAWQTGNFLATSNQVNGSDSTSNNFWVTQIKLELGDTATPFIERNFADEMQDCLRQYYKTFDYAVAPAASAGTSQGYRWNAVAAGAVTHRPPSFVFPAPMRITPTITFYNPTTAASAHARDAVAAADCTATTAAAVNEKILDINCTGAAGTAVGNSIIVCFTAEAGF